MDKISANGISLAFNREGGMIDSLVITTGGGELRPLHRAPWLDSGETLPDHVSPVEQRLAGDFFCAPFGRTSPDLPIHGWAANGTWKRTDQTGEASGKVTASYRLHQTVEGAQLAKHITLCADHPIVYQSHVFEGGSGTIPIAHHAMVHVPGGARLSFSPKATGRTPASAPETDPARGRSILEYPQVFQTLKATRRADGSSVDAGFYPFAESHEDIVVLSEQPGVELGWSAALARRDGFLFFAVKDARRLPQTVLWMSNGGRDYSPWNSRHKAVVGIEEAAVGFHLAGVEGGTSDPITGLSLGAGKTTAIRYAFGAIPVPDHWTEVGDIKVASGSITLTDVGGDTRSLPFLSEHFFG